MLKSRSVAGKTLVHVDPDARVFEIGKANKQVQPCSLIAQYSSVYYLCFAVSLERRADLKLLMALMIAAYGHAGNVCACCSATAAQVYALC